LRSEETKRRDFWDDYETPDGTCIRDYIHILDLAAPTSSRSNATRSEFFNLGTGGGASVRDVIDSCRKITGSNIDMVEKPRRPGESAALNRVFGKN